MNFRFVLLACFAFALPAQAQTQNTYVNTQKIAEDLYLQKWGRTGRDVEVRLAEHNRLQDLNLKNNWSRTIEDQGHYFDKGRELTPTGAWEREMAKNAEGDPYGKAREFRVVSRAQACRNIQLADNLAVGAELGLLALGSAGAVVEPSPIGEAALTAITTTRGPRIFRWFAKPKPKQKTPKLKPVRTKGLSATQVNSIKELCD